MPAFLPFSTPMKGVLNSDGTLRLEEQPSLPPGPVEVFIRPRTPTASSSEGRDWWQALLDIQADQERRGFVGTVTEIDGGDEGYDERMRTIYENTTPPPAST